MFKEFKEFAMKGNVMDMAVGIIIGAAFGKIITSFRGRRADALRSACCSGTSILEPLREPVRDGVPVDRRGQGSRRRHAQLRLFLNTVIDFLIVAFAIFMVVKQMNR